MIILEHFREHGWAPLGRILEDAELEELRTRADDLMLGRVVHEGLFFQLDTETGDYDDLVLGKGYQGPSLNYRKLEKLEKDPKFRALIDHPRLEPVVRALIDGDVVTYRAVLMNKPAAGGTVLPFHQDGGKLWGLDREPFVQIWIALDDAPLDGGCLEIMPGTHRAGLATPIGGVVPKPMVLELEQRLAPIALPARAGEAILLHNHLWHRSGRTRTGLPRRAFSVCYMSAATRCLRKRRAPRIFPPAFG